MSDDPTTELARLTIERARALKRVPASTYRLQFHAGFNYKDAAAVVPYLADLGITHVYASPYLAAVAGSMHGYDVIDHHRLNPELGGEKDYEDFLAALARHGMSHILDTVPNHVGVDTNDNKLWNSVLTLGRASPFADFFDIDWRGSPNPDLFDRVLLPILGDRYVDALRKGQIKLSFDAAAGRFLVEYFQRRLPVSPFTFDLILRMGAETGSAAPTNKAREFRELDEMFKLMVEPPETSAVDHDAAGGTTGLGDRIVQLLASAVAGSEAIAAHVDDSVNAFNGQSGDAQSFDRLDALLRRQHYLLAWWRLAPQEINYRRFFDINGLAALAIEHERVFRDVHELTLRLAAQGKLTGLRIDHPDGLYDPEEYFRRVQKYYLLAIAREIAREQPAWERADWKRLEVELTAVLDEASGLRPPDPLLYVVAEKILAMGEALPADWQCHGTSGYDFLVMVNGCFVDGANEEKFSALYRAISGQAESFDELAHQKKLLVLRQSFASEVRRITRRLRDLAVRHATARDFTAEALQSALSELIACFPVYRTYINSSDVSDRDRAYVQQAAEAAMQCNPALVPPLVDFVRDMLLQHDSDIFSEEGQAERLLFAGKFQQLTPPAIAKGVEDTAFYVYQRLISLNEVGGNPAQFGVSDDKLHEYFILRQQHWPLALSALSTHDTKRSEDVRARINVLSEIPDEWEERVVRWVALNAAHRRPVAGVMAPSPDEEYLLYQTLVGVWPFDGLVGERDTFVDRINQFMQKAMREAKLHTSWSEPNADWEAAMKSFINGVLATSEAAEFLAGIGSFSQRVAHVGMLNSLSQTLLRLAAPGVPDTYQGTELWDLSLVDPDNRRPVDFGLRKRLLEEMTSMDGLSVAERLTRIGRWLQTMKDGRIKLWTIRQALRCRRRSIGLFTAGEYLPVRATGLKAPHVFAFMRRHEGQMSLCVVSRLIASLITRGNPLAVGQQIWGDTRLELPETVNGASFENVLTGEMITANRSGGSVSLQLSEGFASLPIALFLGTIQH